MSDAFQLLPGALRCQAGCQPPSGATTSRNLHHLRKRLGEVRSRKQSSKSQRKQSEFARTWPRGQGEVVKVRRLTWMQRMSFYVTDALDAVNTCCGGPVCLSMSFPSSHVGHSQHTTRARGGSGSLRRSTAGKGLNQTCALALVIILVSSRERGKFRL